MPATVNPQGPRPQQGQLKVKWGSLEGEPAELVFAGGDGTARADRTLVCDALCSRKFLGPMNPVGSMEPSLIEELEARGYDLTTLTFSISKKQSHPE